MINPENIASIDCVINLLKESSGLKEDVKLALMVLGDIREELAECAEVMHDNKTLMRDGNRTVTHVLLKLST